MNKIIYIEAEFHEGSDRKINAKKLAKKISSIGKKLNIKGYTIISITPITSGNYHEESDWNNGVGLGYGYSFTEGVIVLANKS
jgi:hypothetical protein